MYNPRCVQVSLGRYETAGTIGGGWIRGSIGGPGSGPLTPKKGVGDGAPLTTAFPLFLRVTECTGVTYCALSYTMRDRSLAL